MEQKYVKSYIMPVSEFLRWFFLALIIFGISLIYMFVIINAYSIIGFIVSVILFIFSLDRIQTMNLNSEGIIIKSKIRKIKFIPWNEIKAIRTKYLLTWFSAKDKRYHVHHFWFIIDLDQPLSKKRYGVNGKKFSPVYIHVTKNNYSILTSYINQYCCDLDMKEFWMPGDGSLGKTDIQQDKF